MLLDQPLQHLVAVLEALLRALALGDVVDHAAQADRRTGDVAVRRSAGDTPSDLTAGPNDAELGVEGLPCPSRRLAVRVNASV